MRLVFPCIAVCALSHLSYAAPKLPATDGPINAVLVDGDVTYIGGEFSTVAEDLGYAQFFDATSGALLRNFPYVDGLVHAAVPDGAGGFYIGGEFMRVGGIECRRLARIRADGTVDTTFSASVDGNPSSFWRPRNFVAGSVSGDYDGAGEQRHASSAVHSLLLVGDTLYVGGYFSQVSGSVRLSLAAVDATTGAVRAFNPCVEMERLGGDPNGRAIHPGLVLSLAERGGTLYVGGEFFLLNRDQTTMVGGVQRLNLAAVNRTTGVATPWNPNAALASKIAGGDWTIPGGTPQRPADIRDHYVVVTAIDTDIDSVYVGGRSWRTKYVGGTSLRSFYFADATTPLNGPLARIDRTSGETSATWRTSTITESDATVMSLFVHAGRVHIAGKLPIGPWTYNVIDASVMTSVLTGSDLGEVSPGIVGSNAGFDQRHFRMFHDGATVWFAGYAYLPSHPSDGGDLNRGVGVWSVANHGISPTFSGWRPEFRPSGYNQGLMTNGTFSHPYNGQTMTVARSGGVVFAGSTSAAPFFHHRACFAAIETSTGRVLPQAAGVLQFSGSGRERINALAKVGTRIYAGGVFNTAFNGTTAPGSLTMDNTTYNLCAIVPSSSPGGQLSVANCVGFGGEVHALAVDGTDLLVGGAFIDQRVRFTGTPSSAIGSTVDAKRFVCRVDTTIHWAVELAPGDSVVVIGRPKDYNPNPNGTVRTLAVADDQLFLGGHFTNLGGTVSRRGLAAVHRVTGQPLAFDAGIDANDNRPVTSVVVDQSTVWVAGGFKGEGSVAAGLARRDYAAAFDRTTGSLRPWNPAPDGPVRDIGLDQSAGVVYIAGRFARVLGSTSRYDAAAWRTNDLQLLAWNPFSTADRLGESGGARHLVVHPDAVQIFRQRWGAADTGYDDAGTFAPRLPDNWRTTMARHAPLGGVPATPGRSAVCTTAKADAFAPAVVPVQPQLRYLELAHGESAAVTLNRTGLRAIQVHGAPYGMTFDAATGIVSGRPAGPSSSELKATVVDGTTATLFPPPWRMVVQYENASGWFWWPIEIRVVRPGDILITTQPADQTIAEGGTASFSIAAAGTGPLSYSWYEFGPSVGSGFTRIAGANSPTLTFPSVPNSKTGYSYACAVQNESGGLAMSARAILSIGGTPPTIVQQPNSQNVAAGQPATLSASVDALAGAIYQWQILAQPLGASSAFSLKPASATWVDIPGATQSTYTVPSAQAFTSGTYRLIITVGGLSTASDPATITVTAPPPSDARLLNLSTRALCQTGDSIVIPGFVISGTGTKKILIRGVGPRLATLGVPGALPDPTLTLKRDTGGGVYVTLDQNDDWSTNTNKAEIITVSAQVFAFSLPDGSKDSALLVNLPAGSYTVPTAGVDDVTGVSLVELYDADVGSPGARLINISNRGFVGVGGQIMIPGFVVSDEGSRTFLIRAVGPRLTTFGVQGVLEDPEFTVYRRENGIDYPILSNDDWGTGADASQTAAVARQVFAFSLVEGSKDAAFVVTLPPGAYTVNARGKNGSTGVALVEVYLVP
ncbi:MAG: hypothetical protein IAE82_11180 [Opitutaceae bacterium]|nr:hypothetical protein [Opitutaceae bacterium]